MSGGGQQQNTNPLALAQGAQLGGTAGQPATQGLPPQVLAMLARMGQGQQGQPAGAQMARPFQGQPAPAGQMMQRPMMGAPGMQQGAQAGGMAGGMTPQMLSALLAQKTGLMGNPGQ